METKAFGLVNISYLENVESTVESLDKLNIADNEVLEILICVFVITAEFGSGETRDVRWWVEMSNDDTAILEPDEVKDSASFSVVTCWFNTGKLVDIDWFLSFLNSVDWKTVEVIVLVLSVLSVDIAIVDLVLALDNLIVESVAVINNVLSPILVETDFDGVFAWTVDAFPLW